jgi:hypothetical protein
MKKVLVLSYYKQSMNNTDDSASDEEQLATEPMDYSDLMAMTRPLVITEDALRSLRGEEVFRLGFGSSPEPADRRAEFALRIGEILCPGAECDAARGSISAPGKTGPNLKLKIYLGMS